MDPLVEKVVELRAAAKLSQADLADRLGVSQATVSRLERGSPPSSFDVRFLSLLSKALNVPLAELAEGSPLCEGLLKAPEWDSSWVMCPNPFCDRNACGTNAAGIPKVHWKSWEEVAQSHLDDLNYCHRCGEKLVKDCPSCQRRIAERYTDYCIRCGHKLHDRPTPDEWERIGKKKPAPNYAPPVITDDDIPF